jgi:hypothetical protein
LIYFIKQNWEKAVENITRSLYIKLETSEELDLGILYSEIAFIYEILGDFENSNNYYKLSLRSILLFRTK